MDSTCQGELCRCIEAMLVTETRSRADQFVGDNGNGTFKELMFLFCDLLSMAFGLMCMMCSASLPSSRRQREYDP